MKKIKLITSVLFLSFLILILASCKKDPGRLPTISFKSGTGYTSSDVSLAKNTAFKIGIDAAKSEEEDVLKTFNISVTYDGGTSSTAYTATLTSAQEDNFSYDFVGTTRNQAGTEKYSFTITNRDGLINTVTLTLTVL